MPDVTIHDFRVVDRVLAETDPDAGDVVFLGARGTVAYAFVVLRRLSGPGGVYVDAVDIVDADGRSLGLYERKFEIDGESKPREIVTEVRGIRFPAPGTYTAVYSVFDDVVASFPFRAVQQDSPSAGIVPGPLDAALSKSTILWLALPAPATAPKDVPWYVRSRDYAVWYGYEEGVVYVLVGEGEQQVPGLLEAAQVRLLARSKDKRSLVAEAACAVEVLPKDARWEQLARDVLIGRRLNLKDGDAAVGRWKEDCEIVALYPLPPAAD